MNPIILKSCPWCGGSATVITEPLRHYLGCFEYYVECLSCTAKAPHGVAYDVYQTPEEARQEAINAWNIRPKGAALEYA